MKIYKQNTSLVVEIPLYQKIVNPYMDDNLDLGEMDNLIGIIAGNDCSLSQLIDMDYKGKSPQEGMPILMFNDEEELREICKEFNIQVWKHELCDTCGRVIRGSFTMNKKGNLCWDCELHEKEKTINIT